jgi:DNA-binding winged helix-turn-helix (wHTH) protein
MEDTQPARRFRFGVFEADSATGELRKRGIRVRLHAQPFQVLLLLLDRPGELLTREEISRELWPDGTFVDYEHGVNSAVNRLREALGDSAGNPRFVETLARRGYRFVATVERIDENAPPPTPTGEVQAAVAGLAPSSKPAESQEETDVRLPYRVLASPHELPNIPPPISRRLFLLFQLMYLSFYIGVLANLPEIEDLVSPLPRATHVMTILIVTAAILIPVRAFVLCTVLFRAPGARTQFLKLWGFLLPFDVLWALSPFLLLHHINYGVAISCMALLVYSPFVQRSLALMGEACGGEAAVSASER